MVAFGPDLDLPVSRTALLFPCFRGLSRSARPPVSQDPNWHVLHDLDKRDRYIIGGCVDDLWLAVSVLLILYPWLMGRTKHRVPFFHSLEPVQHLITVSED